MKSILYSFLMIAFTATSLFAIPQVVVLDWGGVLTEKSKSEGVMRYLQETLHLSDEDLQQVEQEKQLALMLGKTEVGFWLSYAKDKGIAFTDNWTTILKSVIQEAVGINAQMVELIEELKEHHIQVALLSNVKKREATLIRELGFFESFNPCLLSCEIGVKKPDPRTYAMLLARLRLPAQDVVFIDDKAENIKGAKKKGMDVILFKSAAQVRDELVKRGLLPAKEA